MKNVNKSNANFISFQSFAESAGLKKLFSLILLAAVMFAANAQNPFAQWTDIYTPISNLRYNKIAFDNSGNVITAATGTNVVVIKYNTAGTIQWTTTVTGLSPQRLNKMKTDASGNIYLAGSNTLNNNDAFTIKINNAGVLQWTQTYNGIYGGSDEANSLAIDGTGNVYVAGFASNGPSYNNALLIKYNSAGVLQWVQDCCPNALSQNFNDVVIAPNGNIYATGSGLSANGGGYNGDIFVRGFSPAGGTLAPAVNFVTGSPFPMNDYGIRILADASSNIFVYGTNNNTATLIKYNSVGTYQWTYNIPSNSLSKEIVTDASGNFYIVAKQSVDSKPVVAKVNSSGVEQWNSIYTYAGSIGYNVSSIAIDASQNVYIFGTVNDDYMLVKYNSAGNFQWEKSYNGSQNAYDAGNAMIAETGGNVYVTGTANQGQVNEYQTTIKYVDISISTSSISTPICPNTIISVPYTISGTYTAGNTFSAELSDNTGSFASPVLIGTLNSTTAGTINALIPSPTPAGSGYRIRVVSSNPAITGSQNSNGNLTINAATNPSVSIAITSGTNNGCATNSISFTATPTNGGSPTYQWKMNGINVGSNSPTYTNASWANGDVINCIMTATGNCLQPNPVYSNTIIVTTENTTANSWQQKADLGFTQANGPTARYGSVSFSIGNKGYIGTGADGGYKNDFWEYDPGSNTWTQKANFGGTARVRATGFSIGSKGYIGTGEDVGGYKNDFWEYEPAGNSWTQKANFGGTARVDALGFSIGSKGYIGTGADGGGYRNDFWEFDPAGNIWTQKANFGGTARFLATGFSIGSKGYIGTGADGGGYRNDFWEYEPAGNTWTQKANFGGTARASAIGFGIDSKGYIGTGEDVGGRKTDFWEYDPSVNSWTQKANFGGTARVRATGFSIGSRGYIGIGQDVGGSKNDFWEYTPAVNNWTQKANFGGTVRTYTTSFSIGSKGYIGTGYDGTAYTNDFWEYDPAVNTWTQKANFGGTARVLASGFSIGSRGYIGTGEDGGGSKNDFWEYDPSVNSWTQKANFGGTARSSATGFSIGSKGYIGTGYDNTYTNDFWEYDPSLDIWTQKANFGGTGRRSATGFSIGSKGYIGTGYDNTYKHDFWEYDPSLNTWTQKANFGGTARYFSTGFSIGSKGYIGTGHDITNTNRNDFWEYDPSLNTWIQKANFGGTARNYATGFSIGSKGYIGTGLSDIGPYYYTNGLWEYTPDYSISTGAVYSPLCAGAAISVPYTFTVPTMACGATPNFTFVAQLSNAVGSFVSPINIGSTVANGSGTINATIPANTAGGVLYRVRVIIVSPSVIGSDNGADVTINVAPIATTVSTGGLNVCAGQTNLYGVSAPGATNYTWSLTPPIAGVLTPNGVSALVDWSAAYSGTATLSCVPSNTCGNGTASNFVVTVNSTHGVSIAAYPYQGTFGGKHYYLSNTTATWSAAKIAAEGQCTNLVAVSSGTEQTYVGNILNTTSRWLGGTDEISEGTFRWVNGEPDFATYSNWYTGEPNNGGGNEDDMEMRTNTTFTNKWGDATGGVLQRFILERTDNESLSIVSISDSVLCANSTFNATFSNTGVYDIGNSFKVELSNNTGAFTTSTIIGTQTASSVGTINCTIPNGTANGSGYRIRLISSSPADTLVLTTTFVVGPLSASSTLTGDPFIRCNGPGTSVYSASPVTHALSYTWSISPTTAGTIATAANSVTVTWASAFSGMATLTVTANSGCAASSPATFNIASLPWQSSSEFTETMGSVAASTPVAAYETANGFDNAAYTMSASSAVVVNNTNNSSGYAGASGGANVQIPVSSTLSSRSFIIDGINTIGKNNLVLRLGVRYTSIFSGFSVAASTDGVTYTTLNRSYTEPSANWKEVVVVSGIPQTANLRLRFSGSILIGSTLYVDDIRLSYTNSATPTITAAGPTSFCSGDSVQLRPSVSYTGYLWSNGGNTQVITASTAGTYNMQALDNYGCASSASNAINVTAYPLPVVSAGNNAIICQGNSVTLGGSPTASGGTGSYGYLWSPTIALSNTGIANPVANPSSDQTYGVTVTDANSCSASSTISVTVSGAVTWYLDIDNDGYYTGSGITQCTSPGAGYVTVVLGGGDCAPNDPTKWQNLNGYVDVDGDGYTVGGLVSLCIGASLPVGYSATSLGTDCNDADNTKWQSATLYIDNDNDGYESGTATVCYGASIPAGYKTTTLGSDCNDNDATKYATFSFYADTDGDGFGAGSLVNNICAVNGTTPPSGYATNNTDCAPSDPTKWQSAILYIDNDNDGYDNGTATVCYGASIPSGYKATTLGSDCNDTNALLNLSCGTSTWLGNTTQWSDPTNWSSGLVPNSCSEDVLIPTSPTGGLFPLIDLAPFTVGNIEVQQGATLTLNNVGQLFVCGDFIGGASTAAKITGTNGKVTLQGTGAQTVTGKVDFSTLIVNSGVGTYTNSGTITIAKMYVPLSGAFTNSGSMTFLSTSPTDIATIDLTTGNIGTLTGNIVAQRYVPVSGSNQHYVSSPVNNLPLSQLGASGTAGYVVPTGTCDETVLASGSPYGNVFRYNEANGASCSLAGWEVVTSGNAENARGYSAYLTGAGAISVTGTANMDFNYAKGANTNSGWTNTTLQGRTQNSGWTLVGNPYLSTINLSDKTAAGFDNQAQVWQTSGPYIGTYQPLTMGGGSAFVAPFQGFMVHKTAVGGSSTFGVTRNECVNSTASFYKTGNGNGSLSLKVSGNGFNDITKLTFDDQATNQFDIAIDANKLPGRLTQPMIATKVNNVLYSINNLESINTNPTVPVEFMVGTNGNYTITVDDISTFDPTVMIYLEDKVTNAPWIDLRQNNVYTFSGTTTQTKDRFAIHFSPAAFAAAKAADCNNLGSIELEQEGNTAWAVSVKEVATATIKAAATLTSTSPMTIAGLQTGDYEVTMVHSSGYTVVKNLTISGSNPVSASFLCSNYWPIVGQSIVFSSTVNQTGTNINWDFGDGNTSSLIEPTHVYSSQGTYYVTMTASNVQGCSDSSSKSVTVTAISTGIDNNDNSNEVFFFVKENKKIEIRFFGYKGSTASIGLYNVLGQELHFGNYRTDTSFEYISSNESFQYVFVKVIIGGKTILKKLTLGCN